MCVVNTFRQSSSHCDLSDDLIVVDDKSSSPHGDVVSTKTENSDKIIGICENCHNKQTLKYEKQPKYCMKCLFDCSFVNGVERSDYTAIRGIRHPKVKKICTLIATKSELKYIFCC